MGQKESSGVSNCFQSIFTSGRIDRERILWRIFIESRCFDVANIWYSCRCHKIVFSDLILWAAIEKLSEFPADFFVFQGKLDCRFQITEFAATIIANSIEFISEYRFASQEGFYGHPSVAVRRHCRAGVLRKWVNIVGLRMYRPTTPRSDGSFSGAGFSTI